MILHRLVCLFKGHQWQRREPCWETCQRCGAFRFSLCLPRRG